MHQQKVLKMGVKADGRKMRRHIETDFAGVEIDHKVRISEAPRKVELRQFIRNFVEEPDFQCCTHVRGRIGLSRSAKTFGGLASLK